MSLQQRLAWLLSGTAITIIGCDSPAAPQREFIALKGKISVGSRVLPHVMVMLMPSEAGLRARGTTDGSGEFALISEDGSQGIGAGEYIVLLKAMKLDRSDQPRADSLERFKTKDSSPIRVNITHETKRLDIDLQIYIENLP